MSKYTVYFHNMVEELEDVDTETEIPNGYLLLGEEEYAWLLNKNLRVRFMDSYKSKGEKTSELHFECWLDFEAKNDKDAIKRVDKVLEKDGFDGIDVFYILEQKQVDRIVYSRNIPDEDVELKN